MAHKNSVKKNGEPKVIELNLSATVAVIIAIIVLILTVTSVKVITTIIEAEESKKLNNEEKNTNERVTYVNSTLKDESGNIVNETDANGKVIQVPVSKGYSASQIEGETTASKGFVIYEGDVDWSTILVDSKDTQSNTAIDEAAFPDDLVVINENLDEPAFPDDLIVINENMPESDITQDESAGANTADDTTNDTAVINATTNGDTRNEDSTNSTSTNSSSGRTALNWTETNGIMNITDQTSQTSYREPNVLQSTTYDRDGYSYMHASGLGETRYEMLAQELEQNYYEIIESIKNMEDFI